LHYLTQIKIICGSVSARPLPQENKKQLKNTTIHLLRVEQVQPSVRLRLRLKCDSPTNSSAARIWSRRKGRGEKWEKILQFTFAAIMKMNWKLEAAAAKQQKKLHQGGSNVNVGWPPYKSKANAATPIFNTLQKGNMKYTYRNQNKIIEGLQNIKRFLEKCSFT